MQLQDTIFKKVIRLQKKIGNTGEKSKFQLHFAWKLFWILKQTLITFLVLNCTLLNAQLQLCSKSNYRSLFSKKYSKRATKKKIRNKGWISKNQKVFMKTGDIETMRRLNWKMTTRKIECYAILSTKDIYFMCLLRLGCKSTVLRNMTQSSNIQNLLK